MGSMSRRRLWYAFASYMQVILMLKGTVMQYSQFAPHDTAKLVELQGGNEAFIHRLDFIFDNVSLPLPLLLSIA